MPTNTGSAVATNVAGTIEVSPALLVTAPPAVAWLGMQDLHDRAIGGTGLTSRTGGLTEYDAWGRYGSALTAVLGQLAVIDATGANDLLGSLTDYIAFQASMTGLESPLLSAFGSAMRLGDTPELRSAAQLVGELGIPDVLGGGADATAVLDSAGTRLGAFGVDQLTAAFGQGAHDVASMGQAFSGLFRDGGADVGDQLQRGADAARDTGVGSTIGGAIGQAVGGPLVGRLGSTIGGGAEGLAKGVINFFGNLPALFDSGEKPARAETVVVDRVTVTDRQNDNMVIHPDGTVEISHTEEHVTEHTQQRTVQQPAKPDRCQVDDASDFQPSFWGGTSATLVPGGVLRGPGVDGLTTKLGGGTLRLEGMPVLDKDGLIKSTGVLPNDLVPNTPGRIAIPTDPLLTGSLNVIRTAPRDHVVRWAVESLLRELATTDATPTTGVRRRTRRTR